MLSWVGSGKKVAYSGSFATTHIPNEYKNVYSKALAQYDSLSVREESSLSLVKELSGKNNTLEFNVINHYTEVYLNDKLVYELKKEKIKKYTLVKVPLTKKDINKTVKIILTPVNEDKTDNTGRL